MKYQFSWAENNKADAEMYLSYLLERRAEWDLYI